MSKPAKPGTVPICFLARETCSVTAMEAAHASGYLLGLSIWRSFSNNRLIQLASVVVGDLED
jgi:hypothetical protein